MTDAVILQFPRRVVPATTATAAPAPDMPAERGGTPFTPYRNRRTGRMEFLTPMGRAYRIGGRWFIGIPARLVTVRDTIDALDAAERKALG